MHIFRSQSLLLNCRSVFSDFNVAKLSENLKNDNVYKTVERNKQIVPIQYVYGLISVFILEADVS